METFDTDFIWLIGIFLIALVGITAIAMYRAPVVDENENELKDDSEIKQNLHPKKNRNVTRGADGRFKSKANV